MIESTRRERRRLNPALIAGLVVGALAGGIAIGAIAPRLFGSHSPAQAGAAVTPAPEPAPPPAPVTSAPGPSTPLTFERIAQAFRILSAEQRAQALRDKETFAGLVRQEAARESVIAAARAAGFDRNPSVGYLVERSADQTLADLYLRQAVRGQVPSDFPSEAQMRTFYDQNPKQFTTEERVPIWQIFVPVPSGANTATVEEIEAKCRRIADEIRAGKLGFSEAAAAHSGHPGSRYNGGAMGLLKTSELVPEIRAKVLELAEGAVSSPLRAKDGFHIVRRGAVVPAQVVPLAQVRDELRKRLRQLAQARVRQAAVQEIGRSGPTLTEAEIEAWRLELRAAAPESPD